MWEEEEEEEEEVEGAPLGRGMAPQKPDLFRAPVVDGIPAKNHDDEERVKATCFLYFHIDMHLQWRGEGGEGGRGGANRLRQGAAGCHMNNSLYAFYQH